MPSGIQAKPPDLTTVDLSTLDTTYNYNLGPTGMRGWMLSDSHTALGTITAGSWQILVVGVGNGTPAAGIMANNDVILGVSAGAGTPVPVFTYSATNDIRKSFMGGAGGQCGRHQRRSLVSGASALAPGFGAPLGRLLCV